MPMFHAFINVAALPTLRGGGQVITLPKFEPEAFKKALIEYKVDFESYTINKWLILLTLISLSDNYSL